MPYSTVCFYLNSLKFFAFGLELYSKLYNFTLPPYYDFLTYNKSTWLKFHSILLCLSKWKIKDCILKGGYSNTIKLKLPHFVLVLVEWQWAFMSHLYNFLEEISLVIIMKTLNMRWCQMLEIWWLMISFFFLSFILLMKIQVCFTGENGTALEKAVGNNAEFQRQWCKIHFFLHLKSACSCKYIKGVIGNMNDVLDLVCFLPIFPCTFFSVLHLVLHVLRV